MRGIPARRLMPHESLSIMMLIKINQSVNHLFRNLASAECRMDGADNGNASDGEKDGKEIGEE